MPSGRLFPSPPGVHIRWGSRVCKAFLLWLVTAAMAISLSLFHSFATTPFCRSYDAAIHVNMYRLSRRDKGRSPGYKPVTQYLKKKNCLPSLTSDVSRYYVLEGKLYSNDFDEMLCDVTLQVENNTDQKTGENTI